MILAAIRADGTDERQLATILDLPRPRWLRTVAWSPDGGHLLYSCGADLCVATADGRSVGRTPSHAVGTMGAWAPDGSRFVVAVSPGLGPRDEVLYTVAADGTQWCPLVRLNTAYVAPVRNVFERLWRQVFGGEPDHPLDAVGGCEAAA